MNDFLEIIKARRSIRRFSDQPVPDELVEKLIETSIFAPSACNRQLWRFIIVKDDQMKRTIIDLGGAAIIGKAPVGILVTYCNQTANIEYMDYYQSASAAIQNMLLAAHVLGLGGCWICHLPSKSVLRKLFHIPRTFDPIAYVILGYPAGKPINVARKFNVREVISVNSFGFKKGIDVHEPVLIKRCLTVIYRHIPLFIKKRFLNRYIDRTFVKKFEN